MLGELFSIFVDGTKESRNAAREEWREESREALRNGKISQREHNEWMCSLARADAEEEDDDDDDDHAGGLFSQVFGFGAA